MSMIRSLKRPGISLRRSLRGRLGVSSSWALNRAGQLQGFYRQGEGLAPCDWPRAGPCPMIRLTVVGVWPTLTLWHPLGTPVLLFNNFVGSWPQICFSHLSCWPTPQMQPRGKHEKKQNEKKHRCSSCIQFKTLINDKCIMCMMLKNIVFK